MKGIWVVSVIVSILILGFVFAQEADAVGFTATQNGNWNDAANFVLKFDIVFKNTLEEVDLDLEVWDLDRNTAQETFASAIIVQSHTSNSVDTISSADMASDQSTEISAQEPDSLDKVRDELIESKDIPAWIKTSTGWWSDGSIKDNVFVLGIQHLIQNDIIKIPNLPEYDAETAQEKIPNWIKNIGGWWATDQVSDEEFIQALQWLIANGVMEI